MKVFVSWSGKRSQELALALREWLPLVLHYVEPWVSEKDIAAGERWAETIAKELEGSNFGIICVSRENLDSSWLMFETGSLAKKFESSRVIPLLLDLEIIDISGPLAQFQAKKVDKEGLAGVIESINRVSSEPIPEPRAKQLFEALWSEFAKKVEAIPKTEATKPSRPQHQVLEELVTSVRSLESGLREVSEISTVGPSRYRRGIGRFHPLIVHELSETIGAGPGDPIVLLLVASLIREDMPWLYELALDAYRSIKSGTPIERSEAIDRLGRASRLIVDGPLGEELGADPRSRRAMFEILNAFERVRAGLEPAVTRRAEARPRRVRGPKQD